MIGSGLSDNSRLVEKILVVLRARGGRTARNLSAELGVEKSPINSALYSNRQMFERSGDSPPTWTVRNGRAMSAPETTAHVVRSYHAVGSRAVAKIDLTRLCRWQQEDLSAWRKNMRQGIVEAVTGAGKTRLGRAAAAEALAKDEKVEVARA